MSNRGILNPRAGRFSLSRPAPSTDLAGFVELHWLVAWDLRGSEPYLAETLPHPSVHLVFEPGSAVVHGIWTHRFSRRLEGKGWGLGTKFRPGAFEPFSRLPVAELTDRAVPLREALGPDGAELERDVRAAGDNEDERVVAVEDFLRRRLPGPDPARDTAMELAEAMLQAPAGTGVDELARAHGLSARTLQRLFRRYLGVPPKWVLQRYRLHAAAEHIATGDRDLARMAQELGYFDQAHFSKDFKALVGRTPADYAAESGQPSSA